MQSYGMADRICKGDHQRFHARPQEELIALPSMLFEADGQIHAAERGVGKLTCQNLSAIVAVQIFADGTDGGGAVPLKELAATGGTAGLGSEMDLTSYANQNIYIKGIGGNPSLTLTKYQWIKHETA